jgi:hypothetical protein
MMSRILPFQIAISFAIAALGAVTPVEGGQQANVVQPYGFAVSPPLRDLAPDGEQADGPGTRFEPATGNFVNVLNFNGVGNGTYAYPDSNGAAGATQYVQWTNTRYAVYSKSTGKLISGPTAANKLWTNLGGQCATTTAGDGIINYDKAAERWIITHHTGGGVPYSQCIAISTSSDATGTYYLYAFSFTNDYPDYPQLGVWSDAYYLTENLLDPTGFTNIAGQVCALDRTNMLIGNPAATAQCLQTATNAAFSVLQPADLDGATPPPAGTPNYLMAIDTNSLDLFKFTVNWTNPADTSLVFAANIPVSAFTQACSGGYCIPQKGTTEVLDGVGDRLLHRLAYRNFGTYDVLLVTHSVVAGSSVGVRWYEIRNPATAPVAVYQQGTYAPDSNYRWLGSIAEDRNGDIAIGYSISSKLNYPAIRFTGRLPTDPLGTMETEVNILSGTGAQTTTGNDWGNASSLTIDPVDDCTFWYTNEYMKTTGVTWETRITSLKFASCK